MVTCTDAVWAAAAGSYPCGDRISWLQNTEGDRRYDTAGQDLGVLQMAEVAACVKVAYEEFPLECGGCDPMPKGESLQTQEGGASLSALRSAGAETEAPSVLLPVLATASASLLVGVGAGLRLGKVSRGRSPFSTRARTSISEITISGMGGDKSGPENLLHGAHSSGPREDTRQMFSRAI